MKRIYHLVVDDEAQVDGFSNVSVELYGADGTLIAEDYGSSLSHALDGVAITLEESSHE